MEGCGPLSIGVSSMRALGRRSREQKQIVHPNCNSATPGTIFDDRIFVSTAANFCISRDLWSLDNEPFCRTISPGGCEPVWIGGFGMGADRPGRQARSLFAHRLEP